MTIASYLHGRMATTRQELVSWMHFSVAMNAWFVYCDSYHGLIAYAAVRTNQMGYMTVIAWPGSDLWQYKQNLSLASAFGTRFIYCHKSLAPCYMHNYYIILTILIISSMQKFKLFWE